jgi:hypothetical protein
MNNRYYSTNFLIHVLYGIIVCIGAVEVFNNNTTLAAIAGIIAIAFAIPIPIITNIYFVKRCKRWREIILCIFVALSGWYLAFLATAMVL